MGIFDDVLAEQVTDSTDREVLAGYAKKYPGLEKAVLAQREFSRRMNELTAKEIEYKQDREQLTAWEAWRDQHWDGESKMTKAQKAAYDRLNAAEARVAELMASQGTGNEMTFDEIQQNLVREGYVKKGDIEQFAKQLNLVDSNGLTTGLQNQAKAFEHIYVKATPFIRKFEREFNEDMDFEAFYKTIATPEAIADIPAAYEKFIAPKRAELQVKKAQQQVEELNKQIEEKKTVANSAGQPTDNGAPVMGHMQKAAMERAKGGDPAASLDKITAPLGSGALASAIAADYAKQSAGGTA